MRFWLLTVSSLLLRVNAKIAPDVTTLIEGYNLIAKLPCIGCPFLYQDTSKGNDGGWKQREDENALLLNISLPYTTPSLHINNGALTSSILPRLHAPQVLSDISKEDITALASTNQLDSPNGAFFGLSYTLSLQRLKPTSSALLLHFDVFELWTDLPGNPLTVKLLDPKQKILEVVLLQRPLLSPGDGDAWEIVRAELIARPEPAAKAASTRTMKFLDWDAHGEVGTPAHLVNSASDSVMNYISSGAWALFVFVLAVVGLFVVLCLFCIFACGGGGDDYGSAQRGKMRSRRSGSWVGGDVEKAKGRFRSAEEMGLRGGGRVVGVGKSD